MSIKSLFENIADAIKDKNPNVTNVTPAEMPSAIRSIPSGSSTARGVSYDNTSSGLTASNVQDAIDELSGDVSTINSDLSELETKFNGKVGVTGSLYVFTATVAFSYPTGFTKDNCFVACVQQNVGMWREDTRYHYVADLGANNISLMPIGWDINLLTRIILVKYK